MVDAGRAELDRRAAPGAGGELFRAPEPEAGIAPGLEHGTRFVAVEGVRARRSQKTSIQRASGAQAVSISR